MDVDPGDERAHLELMRQFVAAGDRYGALRQFDRLDRTLRTELGVQPSREAVQLRDRLLHQEAGEPPDEENRRTGGRAGGARTGAGAAGPARGKDRPPVGEAGSARPPSCVA